MAGYFVNSGQTSSGLIISNNTLVVNSGGVSEAAEIFIKGRESVFGTEVSGIVHSGGSTSVFAGGFDVAETVYSGGTLVAVSGAQVSGALLSGGTARLFNAESVSAVVYQSGNLIIQGGGTATRTIVSGGGASTVASRGVAIGTMVMSQGKEAVLSGGVASGTTVGNGGYEQVFGTVIGTTVSANGQEEIFGGAVASGTTLGAQGVERVDADGATTLETILYQGHEYLSAGAVATSTSVASGGILTISAGGTAIQTVLQTGGVIDLIGLAFAAGGSASMDANDVLTVTERGSSYTQQLDGIYGGSTFSLAADSVGGTYVTNTPTPCFCAGTSISTAAGEVFVEDLAIGNLVMTVSGALEPIRWIGRRSFAGRFLFGQRDLLPIVIQPDALGAGLPIRKLRVSPLHAMFIDGVLVPAGLLVNGTTIYQDRDCKQVDYIHIELLHHDVILAEGAPSETFLDDDSRGMFHNVAEYGLLYPATWPAGAFYAPRLESGYELEAIRTRINGLAARVAEAA